MGVVLLLGLSSTTEGQNLVSNGGFEEWAAGAPTGWQVAVGQCAPEQGQVRAGQTALAVRAAKSGDYFLADIRSAARIAVRDGTLYLASLWAKGTGGLRIGLVEYGPNLPQTGRHSVLTPLTPEWRQYQFYYGPRDGCNEVTFQIAVNDKQAAAVLDEVALTAVEPKQPLGPNLVPNGDMNTDQDGDGVPDGWTIYQGPTEPQRQAARGPDGSRALLKRCTPERAAGAINLAQWWNWKRQSPPTASWTSAAGANFAVEPGRTYEVRFQIRGQGVQTYHTKLFWMKSETEQYQWFTVGPGRNGDWEWEEVTQSVTTPSAGVHLARLEFWSRAAGGWLWVDNVSVRPSRSYSTGWVEPRYEVQPVHAVAAPTMPKATAPRREARPLVLPPNTPSRVKEAPEGVTVELSGSVSLVLPIVQGTVYGISEARLGNLALRKPEAPPLAPLLETESGGEYRACRYESSAVDDEGTVTLHTTLTSANGGDCKLNWILKPVQREVGGLQYRGFAYRYEVDSGQDRVNSLADRSTWELGGDPRGLTVVTQHAGMIDNTLLITEENSWIPSAELRFAYGDGFDYQFGPEGGLVVFYDDPVSYVKNYRAGSPDWLESWDVIPCAGAEKVRSPWKCVLVAERGDHDEWTRLRDYVYDRHAEFWGIQQHTPLPLMNCWMHWRELAQHGDRLLYNIADQMLPQIAALGFKVLAVHSVWGRGGCALDFLEPGGKFGGTPALKYLCDRAAREGMIVQAWGMPAHLWQHSPLLEQHPEWLLQGPGGEPPTTYCYPDIRGVRFATGWGDYALGQWRKIREETGLGSIWLDSYANFTHMIRTADRAVGLEQAENLFRFHAQLSQMGYVLYTESTGTFGIPSTSFPALNLSAQHPTLPDPATRYNVSGYVGAGSDEAQDQALNDLLTRGDYYYRCLANKGPLWLSWPSFSKNREPWERIRQANQDYTAVVEHMHRRRTLPEDRGVEWTSAEAKTVILFSFRPARYERTGMEQVFDVTADQPVELADDAFGTLPSHTYEIRLADVD